MSPDPVRNALPPCSSGLGGPLARSSLSSKLTCLLRLAELEGTIRSRSSHPMYWLVLYLKFRLHGLLILQVPQRAGLPRHCSAYTSEKNETSKIQTAGSHPSRVWSAASGSSCTAAAAPRSPTRAPAESRSQPRELAARAPLPSPGNHTNSHGRLAFLHFATPVPVGTLEPGVSWQAKAKRILSPFRRGRRQVAKDHFGPTSLESLRSKKSWGCRWDLREPRPQRELVDTSLQVFRFKMGP